MENERPVVGVDVGGPAKGFNAVALRCGELVAKTRSRSAMEMAAWCRNLGATVVAIDAPCRWRTPGGAARAAERELAGVGISSFSTPTEDKARGHAFYTWMFAGMELYGALAATHSIYLGEPRQPLVCIETFPQAVACAMAGAIVSAKKKNSVRRELLRVHGLNPAQFSNIDEVDAALCAVAAERFTALAFDAFGDPTGGYIIVPKGLKAAEACGS